MVCYWHITGAGNCCYWSVSVCRVLPSQTSLLVQSSGLAAGVLLSNTFADWEAAICFLSLSAEKSKVYLIWKVESRSGTKPTITPHLPSFPLCSQELFAFLSITTSKALTSFTTAFGSQVLLRLCCPRFVVMWQRMLTEPLAAASPPEDTNTGSGKGRRQHIQFCPADFDAQNKFLWGMGHWAKISMCGLLFHVPCCKYKPAGWAGRSGWLQQCPEPPLSSSLKGHPPSVSLAALGRVSALTISNWYYFLSVYIFTSMENIWLI